MTGYEIRILFKTEVDAVHLFQAYESQLNLGNQNLESVLPAIFVMKNTYQSENFHIDLFERNTNEILINCIGTKYPTLELQNLFTELEIMNEHGIKLQSIFDGDGNDEYFYIVNGTACSRQKYSAFHKKFKVFDSKAKKKRNEVNTKKLLNPPKKRAPKENTASDKKLEFDYGKVGNKNTALIRLSVRSKPKRKAILDGLKKHIVVSKNSNFINDFVEFSSSFYGGVDFDSLIIGWCDYLNLESPDYLKTPEELIHGLAFVTEEGNYLYLGFNINIVGVKTGRVLDTAVENLSVFIQGLYGVNKVWVKCRIGELSTLERYVIYSNTGKDPEAFRKEVTEDYHWPNL